MWAATYMRGAFFTRVRTTSRCEGLHTQIGKYVGSVDSLFEFIRHFDRFLIYIRNSEVNADMKSCDGDPVMTTYVPSLERYASRIYTRAVFFLVRDKLLEIGSVKVVGFKKSATSIIYVVNKYSKSYVRSEWHVSFYENDGEWRCSCKGWETYGIPCLHILVVIIHLEIYEIPDGLICKRWTKNAKEGLEHKDTLGNTSNATMRCIRVAALQHSCRRLCSVASCSQEDFNEIQELVNGVTEKLLSTVISERASANNMGVDVDEDVKDPIRVRTKGCGSSGQARKGKLKKARLCSNCRLEGHNKRRCPKSRVDDPVQSRMDDESNSEDVY